MAITIDGSGSVTGISVGGLPDGIVDTDMLAASAVSSAKLASGVGGKIIQAVTNTTSTQVSVSTTTLTDTGLNCSITPTLSSSKILVLANQNFYQVVTNNNAQYMGFWIYRDSTVVHQPFVNPNGRSYEVASYFRNGGHWTLSVLDSPNTTSSITYKVSGGLWGTTGGYSGANVKYQYDESTDATSYMQLFEVAA